MSVAAALPRLLAGAHANGTPVPLAEHLQRYGPLPHADRAGLLELIEASGLRGRGGAGFPAAQKFAAIAGTRRPLIVANGTEGEPLSHKDKTLLRCVPQLVLDGLNLVAVAAGAAEAIVAIGASARHERAAVARALAERAARQLDRVPTRAVATPDTFVAGEETALVSFLSGKAAKPTFVPPRPYESGVRGRPTLVHNVETLAHLALIARFGSAWFRELGTADEPGSALVSVAGAVARPGVYEVGLGVPLRELVAAAGGAREPLSAFLVGGYFGSWITAAAGDSAALLDADLQPLGASLGARAIVAFPARTCGLAETARLAGYLAAESAGQCGPCVHGLASIADGLERLVRGEVAVLARLERWLEQVRGRGACQHPDGAARLVESSLTVFRDEIALHGKGRCNGDGRPLLPTVRARAA